MSTTLNFYDECKTVYTPATFTELKHLTAISYSLDISDANELVFKYKDNENDIITVSNDDDYALALTSVTKLDFIIEISETSKLFKSIFEKSRIAVNPVENLQKEIEEKEKQLRELLEKEEAVRKEKEEELRLQKKREEEAKIKIEEELKIAEERRQKEKEASQKKEAELKIDETEIAKMVAKSLEDMKESIINKIVSETVSAIKKTEVKEKQKVVHSSVTCDGCKVYPIVGIRYKCTVCHDFDYCESCEEKNSETHNHNFIKIKNPESFCHRIRGGEKRHEFKNMVKNFMDKVGPMLELGGITKVDVDIKEEPEVSNCPVTKPSTYLFQAEELKQQLSLNVSVEALAKELENSNGDADKALSVIFK